MTIALRLLSAALAVVTASAPARAAVASEAKTRRAFSVKAMLAILGATADPASTGPIVAVDGVPIAAALMNSSAVAADLAGPEEQLRSLYRSFISEQLARQTCLALPTMVTDAAHADSLADCAKRSDPAATGQALYELITTDLRPSVHRIESAVLLVAAAKTFASSPNGAAAFRHPYETPMATLSRHTGIMADRALHFVMLDDPAFLLAGTDEFLDQSARR